MNLITMVHFGLPALEGNLQQVSRMMPLESRGQQERGWPLPPVAVVPFLLGNRSRYQRAERAAQAFSMPAELSDPFGAGAFTEAVAMNCFWDDAGLVVKPAPTTGGAHAEHGIFAHASQPLRTFYLRGENRTVIESIIRRQLQGLPRRSNAICCKIRAARPARRATVSVGRSAAVHD